MNPGEQTITNDEMLAAEYNSEYLGVTHFQLMETVGARMADRIAEKTRGKTNPRIHVIAGPGKNGGDGFAAARHLASQGYKVRVTLVGRTSDVHEEAAKHQLDAILQMTDSIQFESLPDSSQLRPIEADIILDAVLGYGIKGELRQPLLGAVRIINRSRGYKIGLDLPSGLDSDTGEPHGEAVKADLTISLHKIKQGLVKGTQYAGETISLPIGIPPEAEAYAGPGDFKILWKPRPPSAHPELAKWTTTVDAIVLGPGIGLHEETVEAVKKLITEAGEQNKPMVLDADALKIFGRNRRRLKSPAVLTPHQGEFAQVLQRKISPDTQLRQEAARQLATETGATVVLKANVDIIADTNRLRLNKTGNPYMTVGGTGDILTGIIGAFLSQKADPFRAAVAGAFLNGLAGDILMKEKGPTVTPLALVDHIPRAIKYCADGPPFPPIQG